MKLKSQPFPSPQLFFSGAPYDVTAGTPPSASAVHRHAMIAQSAGYFRPERGALRRRWRRGIGGGSGARAGGRGADGGASAGESGESERGKTPGAAASSATADFL